MIIDCTAKCTEATNNDLNEPFCEGYQVIFSVFIPVFVEHKVAAGLWPGRSFSMYALVANMLLRSGLVRSCQGSAPPTQAPAPLGSRSCGPERAVHTSL